MAAADEPAGADGLAGGHRPVHERVAVDPVQVRAGGLPRARRRAGQRPGREAAERQQRRGRCRRHD